MFLKKGVLKDFVKFIQKHLCRSFFLIKLQAIKKEMGAHVLFYEFCDIFKSTFFTEHLRTTAYLVLSELKNEQT